MWVRDCPDGGAQPIHLHVGAALVRRFTAVLVLLCATAAPAKEQWIRIETDRFVVTTNAKEKDARRLVRELETVSVVFKVAFRGLPEDTPLSYAPALRLRDNAFVAHSNAGIL